jgi:hypothetical protein
MTENATCSVDVEIGEIESLSVEVERGNAINVEVQQLQGDGGGKDAVLYVEQELTEEQQTQARKNIGAADGGEVETLSEKVKDIEADSKLTAEKIEDALGYKPADANNVGGGGVTIDLLWENPWDSDEFGEQEINIPNIGDYDIIEIAHRSNDASETTTRIPVGGYGEGQLSHTAAGYGVSVHSRYFWIDTESGIIGFGTGQFWGMYPDEAVETRENSLSCVPFRIYGIKGVNKFIVYGKFTIDGEEFTFVKGWNWGKWCESQYNTIGLNWNSDYIKRNDGSSTLWLSGRSAVDPRDLIIDGARYELL